MSSARRAVSAALLLALCSVAPCLTGQSSAAPTDPLLEEALHFSRLFDPDTDTTACQARLAKLEADIRSDLLAARKRLGTPLEPAHIIEILNRRILTEREVTYRSNQYWRDSLFTAALLRGSGNCVSTSLLYYLLGRRLGLPIRLATAPEHVFVRWHDGQGGYNIETTDGGRLVAPSELLRRFELTPQDVKETGLLRSLSETEARAELLSIWATTLVGLDKDEEALALIDKALALWPSNRLLQLQRAGQALHLGRTAEALASAERVTEETRSPYVLTQAAQLLCRIQESKQDFDAAIHVARTGLRWAGRRQISHFADQLGRLYRHKRQFERAIAYHQMTADLRYDAAAFNSLGSALTEAHRNREAIEAYETAVDLNPEDFFPKVILAGLYERTGDAPKGRALFERIQRPRGSAVAWHSALVWYYAVVKNETKMLANMKAAFALDPSSGTWSYYQREPDLDPYRETPAFVALMAKHRPK